MLFVLSGSRYLKREWCKVRGVEGDCTNLQKFINLAGHGPTRFN